MCVFLITKWSGIAKQEGRKKVSLDLISSQNGDFYMCISHVELYTMSLSNKAWAAPLPTINFCKKEERKLLWRLRWSYSSLFRTTCVHQFFHLYAMHEHRIDSPTLSKFKKTHLKKLIRPIIFFINIQILSKGGIWSLNRRPFWGKLTLSKE